VARIRQHCFAPTLCSLCFRHSACQVKATGRLSRKSWRTSVRPRRSWRNRERRERRRSGAVGDCRSARTLSAEVSALLSDSMHPINLITSRPLSTFCLFLFLHLWCHEIQQPQKWLPGVLTGVPVGTYIQLLIFLSSPILWNVLTNFSSNHFKLKMGNVKKKRWVCDQNGILTFFLPLKAWSSNYNEKKVFSEWNNLM